METEKLARGTYDIYCEQVGGKAFNGDLLPPASEFFTDPTKEKQANAWRGAADYAIAQILAEKKQGESDPQQTPDGQAILRIKQIRVEVDFLIKSGMAVLPSAENTLAYRNIQRAKMYLGKLLDELGEANPYPQSSDPSSPVIEPTADESPTMLSFQDPNDRVKCVKEMRSFLSSAIADVKELFISDYTLNKTPFCGIYVVHAVLGLEEAKMWYGMELARLREVALGK